jgi:cytochrome c553
MSPTRHASPLLACVAACALVAPARAAEGVADHFEKKVRPMLLAKCARCHGAEKRMGGLRLDAAGIAAGGDSGPAVVPGKPEQSLLVRAVRHDGDVKMPPDGKLKEQEIADLAVWVKSGAVWPNAPAVAIKAKGKAVRPVEPNAPALRPSLQAWYRADTLPVEDSQPVHVWPDSSGNGRDLTATRGVRPGGVGGPGRFVKDGTVNRRPAVRFDPDTGLASSPDAPPDIKGDAALTIVLVLNLRPTGVPHPHDGILGIGNPAPPGDPGRPLAALVMITRHPEPELKLAGGWNHDSSLGRGSFSTLWDRPVMLTIVRKPGPMRANTRFFIDGVPSEESPLKRTVQGTDSIPDIRHRDDIGLYLGKALAWCGSIRGDIGEVVVYNTALKDEDRTAVEVGLAERHGFIHPAVLSQSQASFSAEQKAFWAFQPVKPVTPPAVRGERRVKSPVDRFVLARLEAAGLAPSAPADRRTLLRRVAFDLTGLPPTPAEIDAFLGDDRPDAFERVVDRLLASPRYGERWGRHWLDVARYAETTADDANAVMRYAHRYRDYAARAFDADKPYDRFVVEQLAGDLLPPTGDPNRDADQVIATGFLMVGPKALAEADKEQNKLDMIDDQIDATGRAFLGLTISCARCHDHKFDPIPAADYYSLAGIFRGIEVFDGGPSPSFWHEYPLARRAGEKPLVVMAPREGRPTNLRVALRGNRNTPGVLAPRRYLQIVAGEGHAPMTTPQSGRLELARWIASGRNPLTARVMVNRVWQHHFGTGLVATSDNFGVRGEKPSHPELLDWLAGEFVASGWSVKELHRLIVLSATYQAGASAGDEMRKADPNNRLLGRATRRRLDAESARDAMLAASGELDSAVGGGESGELLFAEGEVIIPSRDYLRPNRVQTNHPIYTTSVRRSIYLPVVRNAVPDVLALFDGADPNGVTAVRNDTTVASQALFLLNHPFVRDRSRHFAGRLLADPAADADRVKTAYRLALGGEPEAAEVSAVAAFLAAYQGRAAAKGRKPDEARRTAWQSFCQTLFCRNEFLYVD